MRIAIHTLGCKANQYETQAMETILRARGHDLVPFDGEADAYVVNSCTVTAVSDRKSRQAVRQARKRAPEAIVALCGCYPQVSPEAAGLLDCDLIGGTGERTAFLDLLERAVRTREKTVALDNALRRRIFEILPAGGLSGRTRAMLKVEDGCTNFCAYCIIPYARGAVRSLPWTGRKPRPPGCPARDTGSWCSPALNCPPTAGIFPAVRARRSSSRRSAAPRPGCEFGWAPWSLVPSRRTSAAGCPFCPTCAPTSISLSRAAATPPWPG